MPGGSAQAWPQADEVRRLVPAFALAIAIIAAVTDPRWSAELILAAPPVAAFAVWTHWPRAALWAVSLAVILPVVVAQRSGQLEPLLFEVVLLAFVVGCWAPSQAEAVALGLLALVAPVGASVIQDPSEIFVGIWLIGIAFPWLIGRAAARQWQLADQVVAIRRELAEQALLDERRRIARDVHDLVGHGLASVMLQVTGARHVLRRDPTAAEEALWSAEEVGRRSLQELRRTVALLRSDDEVAVEPPLPAARDIGTLVDAARAGGLAVELRKRGDLTRIAPSAGVALYRIAQEALANAGRHAPNACTVVDLEVEAGRASLVVASNGPTTAAPGSETERPRYGLIGMRERATALGGEFSAGPTPEGWRVRCWLPLQADDNAHAREIGTR